MKMENKYNELDELMDEIRPINENVIKSKCKSESFARIIIWMNLDYKKKSNNGTIYQTVTTNELAKYMRFSMQRARYILQEMINLELVYQLNKGKKNEYCYILDNEGKIKISEYLNECRKTLNLKLKISQETKDLNTSDY